MNTPITTYTSFGFAIVSYIAYRKNKWLIGALFDAVYGLSVLNHGKYYQEFEGKEVFRAVDKVCVHMIVALSAWLALTDRSINLLSKFVFWMGLAYIAFVYYIAQYSHLPPGQWEPWHASIHLVSSAAETILLLGCN